MEKKFDFSKKITDDINLVAKWEKTEPEESKIDDDLEEKIIINNNSNNNTSKKTTKNTDNKTIISEIKDNEKKKYNIKFNTNGGNNISDQIIEDGNKIIKPTNPIKVNYIFVNWTLNGKTFDFNTIIT